MLSGALSARKPAARTFLVRPLTRLQTLWLICRAPLPPPPPPPRPSPWPSPRWGEGTSAGLGRVIGGQRSLGGGGLSYVFQADRNDMGRAALVKVNAVQRRCVRHRHVVVRDDEKLPLGAQARHHLSEPAHVGIVEGGVHLVEDREWTGVDLIEREHQRQGGERPLA